MDFPTGVQVEPSPTTGSLLGHQLMQAAASSGPFQSTTEISSSNMCDEKMVNEFEFRPSIGQSLDLGSSSMAHLVIMKHVFVCCFTIEIWNLSAEKELSEKWN